MLPNSCPVLAPSPPTTVLNNSSLLTSQEEVVGRPLKSLSLASSGHNWELGGLNMTEKGPASSGKVGTGLGPETVLD